MWFDRLRKVKQEFMEETARMREIIRDDFSDSDGRQGKQFR